MDTLQDNMHDKIACPGLGLAYDQSDHRNFANPLHYCYFQTKPDVITSAVQETYCLTANHIHCPIYLKRIQSNPPVTMPKATEIPPADRRAFKLSNLQSLTLITVLLSLLLIVLLVLLITTPDPSRQSVSSSAGDPLQVITYVVSPTNITPNATWYAELTQQAMQFGTPTLISDLFPTRTSIAYRSPTSIINCRKPDGWIVYTVDYGDTLLSLGRLTSMTVVDLMVANCLTTNSVAIDQEIFLPYYPGSATATRTTTRTPTRTPTTPGVLPPTSAPQLPSATFTNPPPPTNTFVPTVTLTRNPLFRDTPTPSRTSPPTAIPTDTNTPVPTETPAQ